ncbi:hypothetical protein K458DRAFT_384932 [Lentithecium fluviatile CBS 122367]|uniref:Uncharacterized protein n=1 Tax=Lentithecium fluviatile CBS 122367 TaxID=1168545 RepID=A0A6G1JF58_9PLEO|nr:hypothetical protein K458DRAFT_384932 [Lentithecium fluviatile CBS 122367]
MFTFPLTLSSLSKHLLPQAPRHLLRPPPHAIDPSLAAPIAALQLHPTLEATLHILNADLASAHFLLRHMQAPPAVEGMLLHSILHRCEGDMGNARAWARDVEDACEGWVPKKKGSERLDKGVRGRMGDGGGGDLGGSLVGFVYGGEGDAVEGLIGAVEEVRGRVKAKEGNADGDAGVEERIGKELERVFEWCEKKFGGGAWVDATQAWVRHSEGIREKGEDMVSGDQGWRKF